MPCYCGRDEPHRDAAHSWRWPTRAEVAEAELDKLRERCNRYERALIWIASRESGYWGVVANEALYPKDQ
jgi:hypothetical protein